MFGAPKVCPVPTRLKTQIPTRIQQLDEAQPGLVGADTVAHCGDSMVGNFVWTSTMPLRRMLESLESRGLNIGLG